MLTLDLDLHTATVATVKAIVDARVESAWRASGVRILRSDLPFCGIRLRYQNSFLAMDEVLSRCKVREGTTLYADWPQKSEKNKRRTRYGKGWDDEAVLESRVSRNKAEKHAEKKALRKAVKKRSSRLVESSTQSAPETVGDGCVSDDPPGDNTELEAVDRAESGGDGMQGLSEQVANEEQHEQQAEEGGQDDRPAEAVEQDDPFADEDDNKENREPEPQVFEPVEGTPVDASPVEEWLAFDESNSGVGLDLLEVLEF